MEDVIVEIPAEEAEWQPPVLKTEVREEQPETGSGQSVADVFFMQYVICILLMTLLLVVRLYDEALFRSVTDTFQARTHAPSAPWAEELLLMVKNLWS